MKSIWEEQAKTESEIFDNEQEKTMQYLCNICSEQIVGKCKSRLYNYLTGGAGAGPLDWMWKRRVAGGQDCTLQSEGTPKLIRLTKSLW
jgi:hypothetical protein